jgi:hypothetical protein
MMVALLVDKTLLEQRLLRKLGMTNSSAEIYSTNAIEFCSIMLFERDEKGVGCR